MPLALGLGSAFDWGCRLVAALYSARFFAARYDWRGEDVVATFTLDSRAHAHVKTVVRDAGFLFPPPRTGFAALIGRGRAEDAEVTKKVLQRFLRHAKAPAKKARRRATTS